jgi:hypothetical protein
MDLHEQALSGEIAAHENSVRCDELHRSSSYGRLMEFQMLLISALV